MTPNEHVLRALAAQLPTRIRAARHNGLDCVRLSIPEALAVQALLPDKRSAVQIPPDPGSPPA